jgi:hypothetical protein
MGLWRVIGRSSTPALSQAAVSLTLGAPGKTADVPPAKALPTPTPVVTVNPASVPVPVTSPVAIFNASTVRGLASRTAALLRQKGVHVEAVDNLQAAQRPYQGTVFYPPGQKAQAAALANLSGASAVQPAPNWIPADGRLVLVVTDPSTTSASGPLAGS